MNSRMMIADCLDLVSGVILANIQVSEVLDWIYTILLIASITLGIVLKVISAVKDGKVTKEEAEEIKKAVDEAKNKVQEEKDKEDRKDVQ